MVEEVSAMTYLDETADLFDEFEMSCLCSEFSEQERAKLRDNKEMIGPCTRLQYLQTRMMLSIAQSLETIAAKPPYA